MSGLDSRVFRDSRTLCKTGEEVSLVERIVFTRNLTLYQSWLQKKINAQIQEIIHVCTSSITVAETYIPTPKFVLRLRLDPHTPNFATLSSVDSFIFHTFFVAVNHTQRQIPHFLVTGHATFYGTEFKKIIETLHYSKVIGWILMMHRTWTLMILISFSTVYPICSDIFETSFETSKLKLILLFCHVSLAVGKKHLRALVWTLSFRQSFQKWHSKWNMVCFSILCGPRRICRRFFSIDLLLISNMANTSWIERISLHLKVL